MKVFIDLDGVIVNFRDPALKAYESVGGDIEPYTKAFNEDLNITDSKFWDVIDNLEFWSNLPKLAHADSIIKLVSSYTDNWVFLTKASRSPMCSAGKTIWMQKHYSQYVDKLWIVRGSKRFASAENHILIDDRRSNLHEWYIEGGYPFYWPEVIDDKRVANQLSLLECALEVHND